MVLSQGQSRSNHPDYFERLESTLMLDGVSSLLELGQSSLRHQTPMDVCKASICSAVNHLLLTINRSLITICK